jgi:hypothetical protein
MTAKITRLDSYDDGPALFVPGTDPTQILEDAQGELDTDEEIVPGDIRVGWYRVNPCTPYFCEDGGGHTGHWTPTPGKTRGGFQGAIVYVRHREEAEATP